METDKKKLLIYVGASIAIGAAIACAIGIARKRRRRGEDSLLIDAKAVI